MSTVRHTLTRAIGKQMICRAVRRPPCFVRRPSSRQWMPSRLSSTAGGSPGHEQARDERSGASIEERESSTDLGEAEAGLAVGAGGSSFEKVSARAMKFRSLISKFKPETKVPTIKTFTPSREPLVDSMGRSYGLGRRKTSSARVWIQLSEGEGGVFAVNKRPMIEYFPRDHLQNEILKPLEVTEKLGWFHVRCTARGGGQAGQAGAIRLGLARALEAHDPWLRKSLKKAGLMERDSRKVERKKTGLKKARKAPQWVKR